MTQKQEINDPKIQVGIDYISLTAHTKYSSDLPVIHPAVETAWRDEGKGMIGYSISRRCRKTGIVEAHDPNRPDMGRYVQYSGDALARADVSAMEILYYHFLADHKITRIDIAVDFHNTGLTWDELTTVSERGDIITKSKNITQFCGVAGTPGGTIYIGSPKSTKRMRIYDKAAEQGVDKDWYRMELQLRKGHAMDAAGVIGRSTNRLADMLALVRGFADVQLPQIQEAWQSAPLPLRTPRKQSKTRRWLIQDVAKAMTAYIMDTEEDDLLEDFYGQVKSNLHEARNGKSKP